MPQEGGRPGPAETELRGWLAAHGERLLRSAYLLCGDRTEAEDLVQDTFLQAFQARNRFRGDSAVATWLHGILVNLSRHYWRKRKRYVVDDRIGLAIATETEPGARADGEFQSARLIQALQALSLEHRQVVVLRYYESQSLQEIAKETGVSVGTVKSRLHYAARALEKLLPDEMNLFACRGTHHQGPP